MAFEFLYATHEEFSASNLHQGDILFRDPALAESIDAAHQYYSKAETYTHFMVLTQSCDLVRRNGKCKSRYITLAAARPASLVIDRLIERYSYSDIEFPISVCVKEMEYIVKNVVENLLHNTKEGFFFIPKDSHPAITENLCVFLPLSISLRIEHYESCLASKIAQLSAVFQAKVGSIAGHQYSRVGTPDLEQFEPDPDSIKKIFYEELLYDKAVWLSNIQLKRLKQEQKTWIRDNPGLSLDIPSAKVVLDEIPDHIEIVADRIVEQLSQAKIIERSDVETAKNILRNDKVLRKMVEPQ